MIVDSSATHLHPEETETENECDADHAAAGYFKI